MIRKKIRSIEKDLETILCRVSNISKKLDQHVCKHKESVISDEPSAYYRSSSGRYEKTYHVFCKSCDMHMKEISEIEYLQHLIREKEKELRLLHMEVDKLRGYEDETF